MDITTGIWILLGAIALVGLIAVGLHYADVKIEELVQDTAEIDHERHELYQLYLDVHEDRAQLEQSLHHLHESFIEMWVLKAELHVAHEVLWRQYTELSEKHIETETELGVLLLTDALRKF